MISHRTCSNKPDQVYTKGEVKTSYQVATSPIRVKTTSQPMFRLGDIGAIRHGQGSPDPPRTETLGPETPPDVFIQINKFNSSINEASLRLTTIQTLERKNRKRTQIKLLTRDRKVTPN